MASLAVLTALTFISSLIPNSHAWLQYPSTGTATLTHYDLPLDYIASCGCTAKSTHYPTAALSQMAYGSTTAYGPACGSCFKLTLLNSYTGNPPFFPPQGKTYDLVVKVIDLCPLGGEWCSATADHPNKGGQYLNFDLAFPSPQKGAIPDDFFPSDEALYGYTDFGVWNITYEVVSCTDEWAGGNDKDALGSIDDGSSVCCPADPLKDPSDVCPSFSDHNELPPNTTSTGSSAIKGSIGPSRSLFIAMGFPPLLLLGLL